MTPADRVLAECVAAPDDDGPRLVWADLVGGARGELVVVQCDLARGGLAPREAMLRRRRERELLDAHGTAWAGSLATCARRWRFRRGFVETVELALRDLDVPPDLGAHPLVSGLALVDWQPSRAHLVPALARPPCTLLVTALGGDVTLPDPAWWSGLRTFGVTALERAGVETVAARLPPALTTLLVRAHRLDERALATLLARAPQLRALELTTDDATARHGRELASLLPRALRSLVLSAGALDALAQVAPLALEHLSCEVAAWTPALGALASLPLETLEVGGAATASVLRAIIDVPVPTLRRLHVRGPATGEDLAAIVRQYGPRLELLGLDDARTIEAARPHLTELRGGCVGEIVLQPSAWWTAPAHRLPDPDPTALLDGAGTHVPRMSPAWFVRLDARPEIWAIPALPGLASFDLGRSQDAHVTLLSSAVARRHARIEWRAGCHWITDMGSTNGTRVDDVPIASARLHDGATIVLGNVVVRYFVGEGGEARARAVRPEVT